MSLDTKQSTVKLLGMRMVSALMYFGYMLKAMRYNQWIKNLFVFIPAFFAGTLLQTENIGTLLLAFFAFCFGASSIYLVNDLADIEKDKLHPKKKFRPIAAGKISPTAAKIITVFTLIITALLSSLLPPEFIAIIAIYVALNFAYSFKLKEIAFLDIIIISLGFYLRILGGAEAVDVPVSSWLILIVFQLSLFLAFGKRRDDYLLYQENGTKMRKSISGYNLVFIDASVGVLVAITIVCYIMYTVSPEVTDRVGHPNLYITSFPVIIGILRYLQLTFVFKRSGSPTELVLKDTFLQIVILIWLLMFFYFLYF